MCSEARAYAKTFIKTWLNEQETLHREYDGLQSEKCASIVLIQVLQCRGYRCGFLERVGQGSDLRGCALEARAAAGTLSEL